MGNIGAKSRSPRARGGSEDSSSENGSESSAYDYASSGGRRGSYDRSGQLASCIMKDAGAARLYLGARHDGMRARSKKNPRKITHILCLETSGRYPEKGSGLEFMMVPMSDSGETDLQVLVNKVGPFVEKAMSNEKARLLVHCTQGLNRGPTVVAWYLIKHRGMSLEAALALIDSKRDGVLLQPRYYDALKAFAETGSFSSTPPSTVEDLEEASTASEDLSEKPVEAVPKEDSEEPVQAAPDLPSSPSTEQENDQRLSQKRRSSTRLESKSESKSAAAKYAPEMPREAYIARPEEKNLSG